MKKWCSWIRITSYAEPSCRSFRSVMTTSRNTSRNCKMDQIKTGLIFKHLSQILRRTKSSLAPINRMSLGFKTIIHRSSIIFQMEIPRTFKRSSILEWQPKIEVKKSNKINWRLQIQDSMFLRVRLLLGNKVFQLITNFLAVQNLPLSSQRSKGLFSNLNNCPKAQSSDEEVEVDQFLKA